MVQLCLGKIRLTQVSPGQVCLGEISVFQIGMCEDTARQVCLHEGRARGDVRLLHKGPGQVCPGKVCLPQRCFIHLGAGQIGLTKIRTGQVSA